MIAHSLIAVFFFYLMTVPALACFVNQSGPMPICGGLSIDPATEVVTVYAHQRMSRSNILLGPEKTSADYLNIIVQSGDTPLTVIASHTNPTAIRFSGATDRVERVIAMGARRSGWDHVAVDGIDSAKITFLPVTGHNRNQITDCAAPPKACIPVQYFELDPNIEHRWTGDSRVPLPLFKWRYPPTKEIYALGTNTVVIPDGDDEALQDPTARDYPDGWRGEWERNQATAGPMGTLDPAKLLSPTEVRSDDKLPSWDGIASLIEQGAIREAGDYQSDRDLIAFSDAFSARYRSRFDPDFRFEPRIDFVINPSFYGPIPRDLYHSYWRSVTFLRTGRPILHSNKGDKGGYCLFHAVDELAQPRMGSGQDTSEWYEWRLACHAHDLTSRSGLGQGAVPTPPLALLQLEAARDLENHRRWNTKLCRLTELPKDVETIVLSTFSGISERGLQFTHCNIKKSFDTTGPGTLGTLHSGDKNFCSVGHVDVEVKRKGKLFLFLKAQSAVQWNLDIDANTEIYGIATISDQRQFVSGVPEGVKFNQYVPRDRNLPRGCNNQLLDANPYVGGPSALLFEMMFQKAFGRQIDHLAFKGVPPANPTDAMVDDYTTFVVD